MLSPFKEVDDGFDFPDLLEKTQKENGKEGKARIKAQTDSRRAWVEYFFWFGPDHGGA
jgi:hypothetical protein